MQILSEADRSNPDVVRAIRKNERVAREAMQLIAKRNRKLPPVESFEAVANTIGILVAELVTDGNEILGRELATAMRDLISFHADKAIERIDAGERNDTH